MSLAYSPASERNKQPIVEVLERVFSEHGIVSGTVLEVGSGSGQHLVHFAPCFPAVQWQPSDRPETIEQLALRLLQEGAENILAPVVLDVLRSWPDPFPGAPPGRARGTEFDAAYSANTAHIMSWPAVGAMFEGLGSRLRPAGIFCLYGPFNENGAFTSDSNAVFDRQLRFQDPAMGLRDVEAIEALAAENQMDLVERYSMPANNQLLVFVKR